jgi:hypothetical protein
MKLHLLGAVALLAACAGPDEVEDTDESFDNTLVISQIGFAREVDGESFGFDLDGITSGSGGGPGCGVADFVSPDGVEGIDNSFAILLPGLEQIGAEAVEPLLQDAIDQGELLWLFDLVGLDSLTQDDCVALTVSRGAGAPVLGGTGSLVTGQTFDLDPDVPTSEVACAEVAGGVLTGGPLEIALPLAIFDESLFIDLQGGIVGMELREDGTAHGYIGAGISIEQLAENIESLDGVEGAIISLALGALSQRADLEPDATGACTQMSMALEFEAISAFHFD